MTTADWILVIFKSNHFADCDFAGQILTYRSPMKLLLEIPAEHYDLFVAECDISSRAYTILKNSVVARDQAADPDRRVIQLLCDEDEALKLLSTAIQVYPEVTSAISAAIDRARKS